MRRRKQRKSLIDAGVGAGVLGALLLALRYAIRKPTKVQVPDTISPSIFKTKVLHTTHGEIVYHESGSGQPLLFVHALCIGASSYEWSRVYPAFALNYRVIALDLIGFGESARPDARLQATDYVRVLAEFIRATCDNQPPILVASGLGAGLCVYLASQHPELVSRLILTMPTGRSDFGAEPLPLKTRLLSRIPLLNRFFYRNYQSTKAGIRAWLLRVAFADSEKIGDEVVDVFAICAQQYGAEHAVLNLYSGNFDFDLLPRMKSLAHPVALLWSEEPMHPSLEWGYRYQGAMQHCALILLQKTGAFPALEDPAQVIEILQQNLDPSLRLYKAS